MAREQYFLLLHMKKICLNMKFKHENTEESGTHETFLE